MANTLYVDGLRFLFDGTEKDLCFRNDGTGYTCGSIPLFIYRPNSEGVDLPVGQSGDSFCCCPSVHSDRSGRAIRAISDLDCREILIGWFRPRQLYATVTRREYKGGNVCRGSSIRWIYRVYEIVTPQENKTENGEKI